MNALEFAVLLLLLVLPGIRAEAQVLVTPTNSNDSALGMTFDLEAGPSLGVIVDWIEFYVAGTPALTTDVKVYKLTGGGTIVGHEEDPEDWDLVGLATITSASNNDYLYLPVNLGIKIPPGGVQGFHFHGDGSKLFLIRKGNSSVVGTFSASDSNLGIYYGISTHTCFSTPNGYDHGFLGKIHYSTYVAPMVDLSVARLASPEHDTIACGGLSAIEPIKFDVRNMASAAVPTGSTLTATCSVDGATPYVELFTLGSDLAPGESRTLTFATAFDLSAIGPHSIAISIALPGDLDASNDSLTEVRHAGGRTRITSFPWVEDFDSMPTNYDQIPPLGWSQDPSDSWPTTAGNWYFVGGPVGYPVWGTLPADHTTGVPYAGFCGFVDDGSYFDPVNLDSPCLDLSGLSNPRLGYWVLSNAPTPPPPSNGSLLSVDIVTESGLVHPDVDGPIGYIGPNWSYRVVDLSLVANQVVSIRFRADTFNSTNQHHLYVDDVAVFDDRPTPGQSPQPGLAVLDVAKARNAQGLRVPFGGGGPYEATIQGGGPIDIEHRGPPYRPLILLAGPLNVAAATYGGIGQFDIGGAVGASGIPSFLYAIGDGLSPVSLWDLLFVTGPSGRFQLGVQSQPLPPGPLTTLQAVTSLPTPPWFAISNAVAITIQ